MAAKTKRQPREQAATERQGQELRYVPLGQVVLWEGNPKKHDLGALILSITRHGFRDPPQYDQALNDGQGGIVAGNGRSLALAEMRRHGQPVPRGIAVGVDGEWMVPVLFGLDSASSAAAEAYGIDHNAIAVSGGDFGFEETLKLFDQEPLADILARLGSVNELPVSLDGNDVDAFLRQLEAPTAGGGSEDGGAGADGEPEGGEVECPSCGCRFVPSGGAD